MRKWTLRNSAQSLKPTSMFDQADLIEDLLGSTCLPETLGGNFFDRTTGRQIAFSRESDTSVSGSLGIPRRRSRKLVRWLRNVALTVVWVFGLSVAWVMVDSFMPIPVTSLMGIRVFEAVAAGKPLHFEKSWVSIDRINAALPAAVLAGEDTRFFDHNGFDFDAIQKAIEHNTQLADSALLPGSGLTKAKRFRLRGGSTISQQTAKNVFLWPARSWLRKGVEVYFTALIELLWTKERILEVYLNVVEWGDGIYGAEAASEFYFHKPAAHLTSREAALLAAVLPNPRKFSVLRPTGYTLFREGTIRARMPVTTEFIQQAQRK